MSSSGRESSGPKRPCVIKVDERVGLIKALIGGKMVTPMVPLDETQTEDIYSVVRSGTKDITKCLDKKVRDFIDVMHDLKGKLMYIKSGTTGHTFKGIIPMPDGGELNFAVKVVAYPAKEGYGDPHDVKRPENAELLMLRALSHFVINDSTPHLVLPITTFDTDITQFTRLAKHVDSPKYDQFVKRYKNGEYHSHVSVLISEWVDGGDLMDYLRKHYKTLTLREWMVIFFQVIVTLAVIQDKFPGFRHNDLKPNNVLVQIIDEPHTRTSADLGYFIYQINGYGYMVPKTAVQVKLWDFDFACIPGVISNAKVDANWTSRLNIKAVQNRYYDLHYFFNMLTKKGFLPQFFDAPEIPQEVKAFVRRVVPEHLSIFNKAEPDKSLVTERGRVLITEEYTTPAALLETDPFFEKVRKYYREYSRVKDRAARG